MADDVMPPRLVLPPQQDDYIQYALQVPDLNIFY